ncbi:unnamed protein product, partial [Choristocarpus tenellus]
KNLIGGSLVESKTSDWIDVRNPANQAIVCKVPCSTQVEMEEAVSTASEAFLLWREVPVQQRQRVMFKLQHLIRSGVG